MKLKKKVLLVTFVLIAAGYCGGETPPGGGIPATPEPVSTTMIGLGLAALIKKNLNKKD